MTTRVPDYPVVRLTDASARGLLEAPIDASIALLVYKRKCGPCAGSGNLPYVTVPGEHLRCGGCNGAGVVYFAHLR